MEPLGAVIPTQEPEMSEPPSYGKGGMTSNPESRCQIDYAPVFCGHMIALLKRHFFFAGNEIIVDTWRQKHKYIIPGDIPDDLVGFFLATEAKPVDSWWEHVGTEVISLPAYLGTTL